MVDIGGASTELIVGCGFAADHAESFKVGCVNTTLRFFKDGMIDRSSFKRAQVAAAALIEEAAQQFSRAHWDEAYGSSGTAGAISEILRAEGWSDGTITSGGLLRLRQAIIATGDVRRLRLPTLKAERQDVIAGGTAVLAAVFDVLGITEMQTARGALRVGVLYDLLGRRERRDLRDATVERLQDRFAVDRAQARRVSRIAQQALSQLTGEADPDLVQQIGWAASLHEVGFAISHNDYHKHGAYLVQHADLAGFSTSDQQRIALLLLGQRGNLKKLAGALDASDALAKIVALRLAVLLCHARRDIALPAWSLRSTRDGIELGLDGGWLSHHPLTEHLLQEESAQWEKAGRRFTLTAL